MSVLNCSRSYCDNIMCERLSSTYGYICDSCYEELRRTPLIDIECFMDSRPNHHASKAWDTYCNSVFPKEFN